MSEEYSVKRRRKSGARTRRWAGWYKSLCSVAMLSIFASGAIAEDPTISTITDRIGPRNTDVVVGFTISHTQNASALTNSAVSSNTSLVANVDLMFTYVGGGANAQLTITPVAGVSGQTTITITSEDPAMAGDTDTEVFVVTIDDPPTINNIGNQSTNEDTPLTLFSPTFVVSDTETATSSLTVTATSTNTALIPNGNITTIASNTQLTLTPIQNQHGSATITVTVEDDENQTDSDQFLFTVNPVNDAPTITPSLLSPVGDDVNSLIFSATTIGDVDVATDVGGETLDVTVTLDDSSLGALGGEGQVVTFLGAPGTVTTSLRLVQFSPVANRLQVGLTEQADVTFAVKDDFPANSADNGTFSFTIESINDLPSLNIVVIAPQISDDVLSAKPFSVTVDDPDVGETFTLDIVPLTDPGFTFGTFSEDPLSFSGDADTIATAIANLQFFPNQGSVSGSQDLLFDFQIDDGTDLDHPGGPFSFPAQFTLVEENNPPDILGVELETIRIDDDETVQPFTTVQIVDTDEGGAQLVTLDIILSDPLLGSLEMPVGVPVVFPTAPMTPTDATTFIRSLVFVPDGTEVPIGQTVSVNLDIRVTDSQLEVRSDDRTRIAITSVNGAPDIQNIPLPADQPLLIQPDPVELKPFDGIVIENDDLNDVAVTVTFDNSAKGTLTNLGGFSLSSPGIYSMTDDKVTVTADLQLLEFEVSDTFSFPPDAPGGTTFQIKAVDFVGNTTIESLEIIVHNEPRNWCVTRADDDLDPSTGTPFSGSLRFAVENAGTNDMITFALPRYPAIIRLNSALGPLALGRNLVLRGPGSDLLTISGDTDGNLEPDVQLFRVDASVDMEGLTLAFGRAQTGGAIYVGPLGNLTLRYCAVRDSIADQWGGGIDVSGGALSLEQCSVLNNQTDAGPGLGGGGVSLYTDQACSFLNTTFAQNQQLAEGGFGGGALYVENFSPGTDLPVTVAHCTFAENLDASDNGSSIHANVSGTMVTLRNSIFADGQSRNLQLSGAAMIISGNGNISDDSTRVLVSQEGGPQEVFILDQSVDRRETDPLLQLLDSGLIPTPGYPPSSGSPAIGLSVSPFDALDQRGVIRGSGQDSGSLEFETTSRVVINEIQAKGVPDNNFVEIYVPRNSSPLDLSGYQLFVGGVQRHVIVGGTTVQPGFGIIIADSSIAASGTPVVSVLSNPPLTLEERGLVELKDPNDDAIVRVPFIDVYVNLDDITSEIDYDLNSMTLAPQFRGAAFLPHTIVEAPPFGGADKADPPAAPNSPGKDSSDTPFGLDNAFPVVSEDFVLTREDDVVNADVLGNDVDADGTDVLQIVDLGLTESDSLGDASLVTGMGATVTIIPAVPGLTVDYDPRLSATLQALPEGAQEVDSFWYTAVDFGTGAIDMYTDLSPNVSIDSLSHRLETGDFIDISGSLNGDYDGQFAITRIDDDAFSIVAPFFTDSPPRGSWMTVDPRVDPAMPDERKEAEVQVTVLGVNDPPAPIDDAVGTDEDTIIRIMGDGDPVETTTAFNSDVDFPHVPQIFPFALLPNDGDVDTDDDSSSLRITGVVGEVTGIGDFSAPAEPPTERVIVTSPAHGLDDGTEILISGYGGHPSYNGFHNITLIDTDTFSIPVIFVDNDATKGDWAILNDDNRLEAVTGLGAEVSLEIFADRTETNIVYNPLSSEALNALATSESSVDQFYYAAEDSHGAVTFARVDVTVDGVNDDPVAVDDPGTLDVLDPFLETGEMISDLIPQLDILLHLPSMTDPSGQADVRVTVLDDPEVDPFYIRDLFTTDEETRLPILSSELLANDSDVDTSDVLFVESVSSPSTLGATVTLSVDQSTITYDPTGSSTLDALVRNQPVIDLFTVTINDGGPIGNFTAEVVVLVTGLNDSPVAVDDSTTTDEHTIITFDPIPGPGGLTPDTDVDIDGTAPDDELQLIEVTDAPTAAAARFSISGPTVTYDPTVSSQLDSLPVGGFFVDTFDYVVTDNSFVFANNDLFKVAADGAGFVLDVLANDRNLSGLGGGLTISEVGLPDSGGTAEAINADTAVLYTPEVNFIGDENIP